MKNPSPDVRFNLVASSIDETFSLFGRCIPVWINQKGAGPMQRKKQRIQTDIPEVASKFIITSHYSIHSV